MFLASVVESASPRRMVSSDHFSVDGTLIEAWASMKSFKKKDDDTPSDSNGWSDFRGEKRSNDTHESKTDPESRLARKGNGREAKLCFNASGLMENRNGLLLKLDAGIANGSAERDAAIDQIQDLKPGSTVGADRAYDTRAFIALTRDAGVTPHVAQVLHRRSAIDGRTTRHAGYDISSVRRRLIEGCLGWIKTIGNFSGLRVAARVQRPRATRAGAITRAAAGGGAASGSLRPGRDCPPPPPSHPARRTEWPAAGRD